VYPTRHHVYESTPNALAGSPASEVNPDLRIRSAPVVSGGPLSQLGQVVQRTRAALVGRLPPQGLGAGDVPRSLAPTG
jgi:hypothetical protein